MSEDRKPVDWVFVVVALVAAVLGGNAAMNGDPVLGALAVTVLAAGFAWSFYGQRRDHRCPACRAFVHPEATRCRRCGAEIG